MKCLVLMLTAAVVIGGCVETGAKVTQTTPQVTQVLARTVETPKNECRRPKHLPDLCDKGLSLIDEHEGADAGGRWFYARYRSANIGLTMQLREPVAGETIADNTHNAVVPVIRRYAEGAMIPNGEDVTLGENMGLRVRQLTINNANERQVIVGYTPVDGKWLSVVTLDVGQLGDSRALVLELLNTAPARIRTAEAPAAR